MSRAIQLAPRLKELRIHLCQKGQSSKGVREFIEEHYVDLKIANPRFPILIRECSGVQPRLWARYDRGRESSASLCNVSSEDILENIKQLTKK